MVSSPAPRRMIPDRASAMRAFLRSWPCLRVFSPESRGESSRRAWSRQAASPPQGDVERLCRRVRKAEADELAVHGKLRGKHGPRATEPACSMPRTRP